MKRESAETFRGLLKEIYGPNPPLQCRARLEAEILQFPQSVVDELYLTHELRKAAREEGFDIDFSTDYGASLIYFLTGCSNVNPLPAHYFCPTCKKTIFVASAEDGWDLPEKQCCGRTMHREGHNIPLEMMNVHAQPRVSESGFLIPWAFAPRAEQVLRDYYRGRRVIVPYETELERDGEVELKGGFKIANPLPADRQETRFVLIPPEDGMPQVDEDGIWRLSFQELHERDYRTVTFRSSNRKGIISALADRTGVQPPLDDLLEERVIHAVSNLYDRRILSDDRELLQEDELNYTSLLRKKAYLHREDTEENPAVNSGGARYSDLFAYREDVWKLFSDTIPQDCGVRHVLIDRITHYTGGGRYVHERMSEETEQMLKDLGISQHWLEQINCTWHLSPKARLVNEILDDLTFVWYQMQESDSTEDSGEPDEEQY